MPKSVLWSRDEHTECKHKVLGFYLDGWFPILGSQTRKLLFVDGFAGPGKYEGGEPGSPLIALDSVRKHREAGGAHRCGDRVSVRRKGQETSRPPSTGAEGAYRRTEDEVSCSGR